MNGTVLLVLLALGAWRLLLLWWHPYAPCRWCKGTKGNWGSNARRHGDCWFCKGRGRRLRRGARTVARATGRRGK
jgi:hypothetical protein